MKTIHRLVLKSYLGPMVLTFFIVMFVLMMNIVWRYIDELVGKGLSAGIIIELMTYFMANMIPMGLPLSMLPTETRLTRMISGLVICTSDMPADFMASSS